MALLTVRRASATPQLNFFIAPQDGEAVEFGGGTVRSRAPLSGTTVSLIGSSFDFPRDCLGCSLSFITGSHGETGAQFWRFAGGPLSSIMVTGTVPGTGANGVLFAGHLADVQITDNLGFYDLTGTAIFDSANPALLRWLYPDLPAGAGFVGQLGMAFRADDRSPSGFTSSAIVGGGLIIEPTPEPAGLLLFASGVVTLAWWRRRLAGARPPHTAPLALRR